MADEIPGSVSDLKIILGLECLQWDEFHPPFEKARWFQSKTADLKLRIFRQNGVNGINGVGSTFELYSSKGPEGCLEEILKLEGSEEVVFHLDLLKKYFCAF